MADATNIKNLIVNTGESSYRVSVSDIYAELGISQERFAELLARDFYCPVLPSEPTESTLTYTDTDGSVNHFAIGQECRVPDVESQDYRVYKFMGTYQGNAVWLKLPDKLSDLENDMSLYSGANVQAVDADEELDEPGVTYLTTVSQVLSEEEKETVKANLGIVEQKIDLTPYATKEELPSKVSDLTNDAGYIQESDLAPYATKEELPSKVSDLTNDAGYIQESDLVPYATKEELQSKIALKQDALVSGANIKTINGNSILGEGNIVIEGGSSGGNCSYPLVEHGNTDTVAVIEPNVFHVWGEVDLLDLSFAEETAGFANEYLFQFESGSLATTLALPDGIKWANDQTPTISENKIYQISILKGLGGVLEFNMEQVVSKVYNFARKDGSSIVFDYPVASEVTVVIYGRASSDAASSAPHSVTLVYGVGEQSKAIRSLFNFESITPSEDDTYIYLYE